MIEYSQSRTGKLTIRYNGKQVCSHVDPEKEAKLWCDNYRDDSVENYIVLGVGCGYHLRELATRYTSAKILGVDIKEDFLKVARKTCKGKSNIRFYSGLEIDQLKFSLDLRTICQRPYRVLMYLPACIDKMRYSLAYSFLLGRSEEGFRFLCRAREEFHKYEELNSERGVLRSLNPEGLVSINELKLWSEKLPKEADTHQKILKALGALVV